MKFYGTPGMLVRVNKNKAKPRNLKSFRFDDNGEFETENVRLINALKKRFKHEEKVSLEKTEKISEPIIEIESEVIPLEELPEDQIRELAKEKKIKNWHNKKIETLILELKEVV